MGLLFAITLSLQFMLVLFLSRTHNDDLLFRYHFSLALRHVSIRTVYVLPPSHGIRTWMISPLSLSIPSSIKIPFNPQADAYIWRILHR